MGRHRRCQSHDLLPSHLEITFLSLRSQGQGAQSSLTPVIYHHYHCSPPQSILPITQREKRKSYLCYLLFWSASRNIQDRHIALILKYRGISRHTEGCVVIIQIRRLWHKSDNLASTYEREKYTELPLKMFTAEKGHAELSDLKRKHSLAQVYVDRFWEPYKCCSF